MINEKIRKILEISPYKIHTESDRRRAIINMEELNIIMATTGELEERRKIYRKILVIRKETNRYRDSMTGDLPF